ncbi:hypothetical protein IV102_03775 [bacterium]|nr:hypothetical protein [bacterium]
MTYHRLFAISLWLWCLIGTALATPEFARRYQIQSCTVCHTVVPKLNAAGMDFLARGYRPAPELNREKVDTVPLSAWLGARRDDQVSKGHQNFSLGKVELISGGTLDDSVSYFIEWRPVSLEARGDGSLRDRSGRFEDVQISWKIDNSWTVTAGQYRPLQQIEPGRRLALSAPVVFDANLDGPAGGSKRQQSLRGFKVGDRSPGLTINYQSIHGKYAMDGLFHSVTVPFSGEFSIPLNPEARREASFEFETIPKGVVLETYYRQQLNSVGVHAFVGEDRWSTGLIGETAVGDFNLLGGVGLDGRKGQSQRFRGSLAVEYLPVFVDSDWRSAIGFRVDVLNDGHTGTAYVPYLVISGPNEGGLNSLLQLEYRSQKGNNRLQLDLSVFF